MPPEIPASVCVIGSSGVCAEAQMPLVTLATVRRGGSNLTPRGTSAAVSPEQPVRASHASRSWRLSTVVTSQASARSSQLTVSGSAARGCSARHPTCLDAP